MGADLYIKKLTDKGNNEEGYFRDPYNPNDVLWMLDLSWWADVIPLRNKQGYLNVTATKKLLKMVSKREVPTNLDSVPNKETREFCQTQFPYQGETWQEYFTNRRAELIQFLQRAIDLDSPIDASL